MAYGVVYGLYDPRTQELRYIGQTVRPIKVRLAHHLSATNLTKSTHSARWLSEIVSDGLRPVSAVLGEVGSRAELNQLEIRLISEALARGCRLTNLTAGGEGISGFEHRATTKLKIGAANRGICRLSAESKARISKANRGRVLSQEARAKIVSALRARVPKRGFKLPESVKAKLRGPRLSLQGSAHPNYQHTISTAQILNAINNGWSRKQVSEDLGVTPKFISRRLRQAERSGVSVEKSTRARAIHTSEITSRIALGLSKAQIAKDLHVSKAFIYLRLRQEVAYG